MKLLPVKINTDAPAPKVKTTFKARPEVNSKIFSELSEEVFKNLNSGIQSGKTGANIKKQFSDPVKKNVFFAAVASLITAAAAQITEMLFAEEEVSKVTSEAEPNIKQSKNSDGDTFEKTIVPLSSHRGRKADFEQQLAKRIEQISQDFNINLEEQALMVDFYNEFCGTNYKGSHYSLENELIPNKTIIENYLTESEGCKDIAEINKLTEKYGKIYTSEKHPKSQEEEAEEFVAKTEPATQKILNQYKNIRSSYIDAVKNDHQNLKQSVIEKFVNNINENIQDDDIRKMLLSRINNCYSSYLYDIANIYNLAETNNADDASNFLSAIINKTVNKDALEKWKDCGCQNMLEFVEYNQLMNNGYDGNAIKDIAVLKRNTKFGSFTIMSPENFTVRLPYSSYMKNFSLLNNIFELMNANVSYSLLSSEDSSDYTIDDIEADIKKHYDSYPNLIKHLKLKDAPYLNKKKMQNLINLYYGNENNRNIFTLHSYLRFLERVALPDMIEYGEPEEIYSSKAVGNQFINTLGKFKQALTDSFRYPLEIQTYRVEDIRAPQFNVKYRNSVQEGFLVTLNQDNKIHTIF